MGLANGVIYDEYMAAVDIISSNPPTPIIEPLEAPPAPQLRYATMRQVQAEDVGVANVYYRPRDYWDAL